MVPYRTEKGSTIYVSKELILILYKSIFIPVVSVTVVFTKEPVKDPFWAYDTQRALSGIIVFEEL